MKQYVSIWFNGFLDLVLGPFSIYAGIASILAFLGFRLSDIGPLWLPVAVLVTIVGVSIILSRPAFQTKPEKAINRRIEIPELDSLPKDLPRICLLGLKSVGKSTLLDTFAVRRLTKRRTEKPYARVVALPHTRPAEFAVVIDTVGQHHKKQLELLAISQIGVLLLDHNFTDSIKRQDRKRFEQQEMFVGQLIEDLQTERPNVEALFVVMNKADLWDANSATKIAVEARFDELLDQLSVLNPYHKIHRVSSFSNLRNGQAAELLSYLTSVLREQK